MPPPRGTVPTTRVCDFHAPDGTVVPEARLRDTIVKTAGDERAVWFDTAAGTYQKEHTDARFGDLVRYWLSGHDSRIHPGKLQAVQKAAADPAIVASYGNLSNAQLNIAIADFAVKEADVNTKAADVYAKSQALAAAKTARDAAAVTLRDRKAAVTAAANAVSAAKRQTGAGAQAARQQADAALVAAKTDRDNALAALNTAKAGVTSATNALKAALTAHDAAKAARKPFQAPAENWVLADREQTRSDVLAKTVSSDTQAVNAIVEDALRLAHNSRADTEAWSSAFVSAVVRAAALTEKLEAMVGAKHKGRDILLKASRRHSAYVKSALAKTAGGYKAFKPGIHAVARADIIVTDRGDFITAPAALTGTSMDAKPILHADIVTALGTDGGTSYAETVGGNVRHTVRRRRYPLDAAGKLILSAQQLYVTEEDNGTFPPFASAPPATRLDPSSTKRIIAHLRLVHECKVVPSSTSATQGNGNGQKETALLLPGLESPFAHEEILTMKPHDELESNVDWIAGETPFLDEILEETFQAITEELETEEESEDAGEESEWELSFADDEDEALLEEEAAGEEEQENAEVVPGEVPWEVIAESLPPRVVPAESAEVQFEHETPALPKGLHAFEHFHQPMKRDAARNVWVPDGPLAKLEPLDPGFFDAAGELKTADLHKALGKLLVENPAFNRFLTKQARDTGKPTAGDQIRVALVDLTGSRMLDPDYAGWGSTVPVYGASCVKVAALYAAFQLRNDLKHVAAEEKLTKTADLIRFMNDRWKRERIDSPPRLLPSGTKPGLLYLQTDPPALEFSAEVDDAIDNLIDPDRSAASANVLIDVIGFPFIASLLWQSGLRHPALGGMWLLANYGGSFWSKPVHPPPLPIQVHNATALSMVTFFTLLGQDRLAQSGLPRTMRSALSTASYLDDALPSGATVASKVGLLKKCVAWNPATKECTAWIPTHTHEAAFIENDGVRYAVAIMITGVPTGISVLQQLIPELDTLIRRNQP